MTSVSTSINLVREGKLRALAVSSLQSVPQLPDMPPAAQTIPGLEFGIWHGIAGPAGMDPAMAIGQQRVQPGAAGAFGAQDRHRVLGRSIIGGTPQQFDAFIKSELKRWPRSSRLRHQAGIARPFGPLARFAFGLAALRIAAQLRAFFVLSSLRQRLHVLHIRRRRSRGAHPRVPCGWRYADTSRPPSSSTMAVHHDQASSSFSPGLGSSRVPGAAQHLLVMRCRTGTVTNAAAPDGPGSAAHHFVPHRVRGTRCTGGYGTSSSVNRAGPD